MQRYKNISDIKILYNKTSLLCNYDKAEKRFVFRYIFCRFA